MSTMEEYCNGSWTAKTGEDGNKAMLYEIASCVSWIRYDLIKDLK